MVLLGLTGELAWTIENMYLNVCVYNTITDDPTVLATLVVASAAAATGHHAAAGHAGGLRPAGPAHPERAVLAEGRELASETVPVGEPTRIALGHDVRR